MFEDINDFHHFYDAPNGRAIADRVCRGLGQVWPDAGSGPVLGYGYCFPFLERLIPAQHMRDVSVLLPAPLQGGEGGETQPPLPAFRVEHTHETAWPIATHSVDTVLMIHGLELGGPITPILAEAWRVLTSQGKLIVIVPNRLGWWSWIDSSPFGHGRPFLSVQMERALRSTQFIHERTLPTLYAVPMIGSPECSANRALEWAGPRVAPALSGLHIVLARKQLYGGIKKRSGPAHGPLRVPRLQTAS